MGVLTKIGWLMRGAVIYVLYWAFGFVVVGCIYTPRPVPLSILLLVTAAAVPITVVAVRKEYRMDAPGRYRERERQLEEWERVGERENEHHRSMSDPGNPFGYWPTDIAKGK